MDLLTKFTFYSEEEHNQLTQEEIELANYKATNELIKKMLAEDAGD
jgi:hypothetical protein